MEGPGSPQTPHPSVLDPKAGRRRSRWMILGGVVTAIAVLTLLLAFGLSRDPTLIRSPLIDKPAVLPAAILAPATVDGSNRTCL